MNILVTGASGFLGKHLCQYLKLKGHKVVELSSKDVDLTKFDDLNLIPNLEYNQIYHLAVWTRAGSFCETNQGDQWIINQKINTNILEWWKINHPKAKMIAFGTSASYCAEYKMEESKYMLGTPIDKFYAYAMTKRMLLVGLESLHKQYNLDYLYLIPSTIYGPNYHEDGRELHFIYDIIKKILNAKYLNTNILLQGNGYQKREIIYIKDIVKIIYELNEKNSNKIINIGNGTAYSIRKFAKIISKIIKLDSNKIEYDNRRNIGIKNKLLDVTLCNKYISFDQVDLSEGLRETIEWVKNSDKL